MFSSVETRCIVCQLVFCCGDCRWKHEQNTHGLQYNCPICRGFGFICKPEELNQSFIQHLIEEHLPLQCKKCNQQFINMEDLINIDKCTSISELVKENLPARDVEDKFDVLYKKVANNNEEENYEGIILVNKISKTAVVTPIIRKKHLVDYECSSSEEEENEKVALMHTPHLKLGERCEEDNLEIMQTPHPKLDESSEEEEEDQDKVDVMQTPHPKLDESSEDEEKEAKVDVMQTPHPKLSKKTSKLKRQRAATPHVKKLLSLMRQKTVEEYEITVENENNDGSPKTTPSRSENDPDTQIEMTTPTSQISNLLKLARIVTTSTPTHPITGGWSIFPEQGSDSPLSEIENAESPAQSINNEPSKSESEAGHPKLKSIIVTGSKIRLGSQDSTEKHVTFQDSNTDVSLKKKVKFAEDTVFEQEPKVKRVYRKPKRMLTPGPQKPRFCYNPRFQALINRFENQGLTMARTPVNNKEKSQESTPPVGELANMPARAINFKDESPVVKVENYSKESNDSYKSCIASPEVNNAITALTANIAGTLQTCLHSALETNEENTEIQFQFIITKRKFSVKRIAEDGKGTAENSADIPKSVATNKENIWSSVAKAVKNAFWGDQGTKIATTTPHRSTDSINSTSSSSSKRKIEDISDCEMSPINHKKHKYDGRIRGRPPLRRNRPCAVNGSWGLPALICDVYIAMDVTSSTSSIFNLVAISVDRYIAVTQPIKYAKHKNNRRVWLTIVLVWMISAAIGAPIVLGLNDTPDRNFDECLFNSQNYVIYSSLGSFYIPCIMMMFLYYSIFKALRNRAKKQRAAKKPPVPDVTTGTTTAVVIENVAQTRILAETALHDDRATNTGSGSNEDDHDDSFDKRSADLEGDADDCHVIQNDKSTEFMLATVAEETANNTPKKRIKKFPDPNGNNDSGYAPSNNVEDTVREHVSPPGSPSVTEATVLRNMGCEKWKKNGKSKPLSESRNVSLALRSEDDHEASTFDLREGSSCKKERKASAATARFTIYKANKASKKKREKSSAKKERKATKTLAIVLGVFLFCWAPFFTCSVLGAICDKFNLPFSPGVTTFILTTWLGYINSFLNPVIYTIFNPEFRKAFRKILHCGT